jgi:hypothetical protein
VRVQRLELLGFREPAGDLARSAERIVDAGQAADERRLPLEQLRELLEL